MSIEQFRENKIAAIIRGATPDNILPIANALKKGGISVIEITMETPFALQALETLSLTNDTDILAGAGTVLDSETARSAIMAGAKFVFSPTVHAETIQTTKKYGAISIPGAYTPTEILTAFEYGADLIKVFPASTLGAGFFKQIAGPLPHIPLMATGGIDDENLLDYLGNGAIAVGIGSALVDTKADLNEAYFRELAAKAKKYADLVNKENLLSR